MNNSSPINPEPVVPVNPIIPTNPISSATPISNSNKSVSTSSQSSAPSVTNNLTDSTSINQTTIQTSAINDLPWQSKASNQMDSLANYDTPQSISGKSVSESNTPSGYDFNDVPKSSSSTADTSASAVPTTGSVSSTVPVTDKPFSTISTLQNSTVLSSLGINTSPISEKKVETNIENQDFSSQTGANDEIKFIPEDITEKSSVTKQPVSSPVMPIESNQLPPLETGSVSMDNTIENTKETPTVSQNSTSVNSPTFPDLTGGTNNINKPDIKMDITSKEEEDKKHKVKSILMLIGVLVLGIVALILGIFFAVNGAK